MGVRCRSYPAAMPLLGRVMVHVVPRGEGGERHYRMGEHTLSVHSHDE